MKLAEMIAKVSQNRPSSYDVYELTQWINEVEFMVIDQVFSNAELPPPPPPCPPDCEHKETCKKPEIFKGYNYDLDADKELLIPDIFSGVYTSYLYAKIDFNNAEIERNNMDALMFDSEWNAFSSWYRRTHYPRKKRKHEAPIHYYVYPKKDFHCKYIQRIEPEPNSN